MKSGITRRILSLLILAAMLGSACGSKETPGTALEENPASTGTGNNNSSVQQPLPDSDADETGDDTSVFPVEGVTLTYWKDITPEAAKVMDTLAENEVYKELEKITGVKIEFIHPPVGQGNEQFGLMIASGDWPDIIEGAGKYTSGASGSTGGAKGVDDGVYMDLTDLIPVYAPNYQSLRLANEDILKQTSTDDGTIWGIYAVMRQENPTFVGPIIRGDWLEDLDIDPPETMNDWYEMLTAFKNEKDAKIPFIMSAGAGNFPKQGFDGNGLFISAYGIGPNFYNDGGRIKYGHYEDGFKDYLIEMNKWYNEGLIDSEFPAKTDQDSVLASLANNEAGATAMDPATLVAVWDREIIPYTAVKFPVLNSGEQTHYRQTDGMVTDGWVAALSTTNKNPEISLRWLDYAYTYEGSMLYNYGIEGVSYEMSGGKPVFTDLMLNNPEMSMGTAVAVYKIHTAPHLRDGAYSAPASASIPENMVIRELWTEMDNSFNLPILNHSVEEHKRISSVTSEIETYRNEMIIKFIMGVEPIENFDMFQNNLKSMGIEEIIDLKQEAFDRYLSR